VTFRPTSVISESDVVSTRFQRPTGTGCYEPSDSSHRLRPCRPTLSMFMALLMIATSSAAEDFALTLRYQTETSPDSGRYHRLVRQETWNPNETAVIVCDVWDLHHSLNAVRRLGEFAPRLDEVLKHARQQGATIIHSPSSCMDAYKDHPARRRAIAAPKATDLPDDITSWCSRIPEEEQGVYPLDQSDGGEDDSTEQKKAWAAELKKMGRNPGSPWKKQADSITIDSERDYISDQGDEVWNVLQQRGIKNVILTGVHVNMCVLGRPFGLRQMARNGKNVVLMRDMTDTMYNPASWPYVSHFTGNDLIVSHIEKFVCPTITSDQLIDGNEFHFKDDHRPHIAIVMGEREYETERTLPKFAADHLGKDFRVSFVFADEEDRNKFPGLEVLRDADIALISVRRRTLRSKRLKIVRDFVAAGKPIIGIRTASHAFTLRNKPAPDGFENWTEFDANVLGGHYTNHHGNKLISTIRVLEKQADHPILRNVTSAPFKSIASLYQTSPLASEAIPLVTGKVDGQTPEPVAWTFVREDGGHTFYTSLGHPTDFENKEFVRLLANSIYWAAGLPPRDDIVQASTSPYEQDWSRISVPAAWESTADPLLKHYDGIAWYRCAARIGDKWLGSNKLTLGVESRDDKLQVWFNGHELKGTTSLTVSNDWVDRDDANLIVIRVEDQSGPGGLRSAPVLRAGKNELALCGKWQFRIGDNLAWSNIPLPARYGASPDMLFEP
jgi:type 1 glutamine amidotransferase/nicotinamidase-related amidase